MQNEFFRKVNTRNVFSHFTVLTWHLRCVSKTFERVLFTLIFSHYQYVHQFWTLSIFPLAQLIMFLSKREKLCCYRNIIHGRIVGFHCLWSFFSYKQIWYFINTKYFYLLLCILITLLVSLGFNQLVLSKRRNVQSLPKEIHALSIACKWSCVIWVNCLYNIDYLSCC